VVHCFEDSKSIIGNEQPQILCHQTPNLLCRCAKGSSNHYGRKISGPHTSREPTGISPAFYNNNTDQNRNAGGTGGENRRERCSLSPRTGPVAPTNGGILWQSEKIMRGEIARICSRATRRLFLAIWLYFGKCVSLPEAEQNLWRLEECRCVHLVLCDQYVVLFYKANLIYEGESHGDHNPAVCLRI